MQRRDKRQPHAQERRQQRTRFGLQRSERDVRDQERVRQVNQHVQALPDGRGQVVQPEIVAGGGHQKQNQQREKSEPLKGKVGQAAVIGDC